MEKSIGERSEFLLPSNGLCFLCLHSYKNNSRGKGKKGGNDKQCQALQRYSVLRLNQYLKINFGDLVSELVSVSAGALPIMEKADVKVELCSNCAMVTESFSKLYEKLEKIHGEVKGCLRTITGKIGGRHFDGSQLSRLEMDVGQFHAKVIEKLREETFEKCNFKLQEGQYFGEDYGEVPLNLKQDMEVMDDGGNNLSSPFMISELVQSSLQCETILLEGSSPLPPSASFVHDYHQEQHQQRYLGHQLPVSPSEKLSSSSNNSGGNVGGGGRNYGKLQCEICHKMFSTANNLRVHQKSIHFGERFSCNLCGKQFTFKTNLEFHKKAQHGLLNSGQIQKSLSGSLEFDFGMGMMGAKEQNSVSPRRMRTSFDEEESCSPVKKKARKKPSHSAGNHGKSSSSFEPFPIITPTPNSIPPNNFGNNKKTAVCSYCHLPLGKGVTMTSHKKFDCAYFKSLK